MNASESCGQAMNQGMNLSKHSEFLLNGLQYLKANNVLCDITLVAEGKRFECHKIILACVSDYFRSMFTSGMKESTQAEIELKGVNANGLAKVIEIVYASPTSPPLTKFNDNTSSDQSCSFYELFEIVAAANHLQCFLVIDHCERKLIEKLDFANFNYFIQMATMYNMNGLLDHIDAFIIHNLARVVRYNRENANSVNGDCFLKSLSYEQLLKCLADDGLRIKEIDLFYLVWKWIYLNLFSTKRNKHNLNRFDLNKKFRSYPSSEEYDSNAFGMKKIEVVRNLLKHIRYNQISAVDLINRVQTVNKIMLRDSCLRKMVLNAVNYQLAPHMHTMSENIRCSVKTILMIGGREINPLPTIYDTCHSLNDMVATSAHGPANLINKATVITTLPNVLSHMQCVVVASGHLYVLGGCLSQCVHGESATNTVLAYDPRLNKWSYMSSMMEKRAYFYACALLVNGVEHIFVFGGKNRDGILL